MAAPVDHSLSSVETRRNGPGFIMLTLHNIISAEVHFRHLFDSKQRLRDIRRSLEEDLKTSREKYEADRSRRWRRHMRRKVVYCLLRPRSLERIQWKVERPHGQKFWSGVLNDFDGEQWREHFRMSRSTFEYVLQLVEGSLQKKTTHWRKPIEPRRRLAIVVWWYATPSEYRRISSLFGVGTSTVCKLVRQVTTALKTTLAERFMCLPKGEHLQETLSGFSDRGYPMCAGAIDTTHIPIIGPKDDHIVLQAVVDHKFCFTDICISWPISCPDRTHDARVLANSPLYRMAEDQDGYLFPRETSSMVNGVEIPVHLIGDSAYPLKKWLMKGFTNHHNLNQEQCNFNKRLSSACVVVENAFCRLKGRWRCLLKRNDVDVELMPDIVTACCILHNVCELNNDVFLPEWNTELNEPTHKPDRDVYQGDILLHSTQDIRQAMMELL